MSNGRIHDRRAEQAGDSLRRLLATAHTGGLAVILATAGALVNHKIDPGWTLIPASLFVAGLVIVAVSWQWLKHREIRRRDNFPNDPIFPFWQRSTTWDMVSLGCFAVGSLFGLYMLSNVHVA